LKRGGYAELFSGYGAVGEGDATRRSLHPTAERH
jgi:hypothetical protein